ncbi:hypothetical protein HMPREF1587_01187 [Bifidobacterium breve JCP7499]|nr:hypothetical protein HMPREF1587_01187 [Bifidobacterium breve JCP7499]
MNGDGRHSNQIWLFYCVVSIVRIYAIRNAKNRSWNPEQNAIVQSALIGPRHG